MKIRMTSFFPDLNVWLALSVASHSHSADAWKWANPLPRETRLIFCRYTQIGLLRLLTNQVVMGEQTLTLRKAWSVYDRWLADPRVEFYPEPRGVDAEFREATEPFAQAGIEMARRLLAARIGKRHQSDSCYLRSGAVSACPQAGSFRCNAGLRSLPNPNYLRS
jgi:predicted nucleic acid-binding protein